MVEKLKIDRIISVSYTDDPSCLAVALVFEGEDEESIHFLHQDDMYGNSPYLRQWIEDNKPEILPYVPPEPESEHIVDVISRRQFFQQLSILEIITRAEALAAVQGGTIPTPLMVIIDSLPTDDDKFDAQMLVSGAQTFDRTHPLAEVVRQAMQWTVEQKDDFWIEASKL